MEPDEYARLRKRIGTQKEVAELLGVAQVTVARRETGKADIGGEEAAAIRYFAEQAPTRERELAHLMHDVADAVKNHKHTGDDGRVSREMRLKMVKLQGECLEIAE